MLCLLALAAPGLHTVDHAPRRNPRAALVPDPWAAARIGIKTDYLTETELEPLKAAEFERDVDNLVNILVDSAKPIKRDNGASRLKHVPRWFGRDEQVGALFLPAPPFTTRPPASQPRPGRTTCR